MATEAEIPETATKSSELEVPEETLAPNTLGVLAPESGNLTKEEKEEQNSGNGPTNSTEKKIRRAERFGVPLQLSEEEKRNSRAQRFGTLSGSDALKSSEELKRKARTERFGPVANSTVDKEAKKNSAVDNEAKKNSAVDNEAKKKARLARFGSNAKIDSQEEEKRKARALRFAQPAPNSQAKTDCKGDVELATQKTAVTGSTIGGA